MTSWPWRRRAPPPPGRSQRLQGNQLVMSQGVLCGSWKGLTKDPPLIRQAPPPAPQTTPLNYLGSPEGKSPGRKPGQFSEPGKRSKAMSTFSKGDGATRQPEFTNKGPARPQRQRVLLATRRGPRQGRSEGSILRAGQEQASRQSKKQPLTQTRAVLKSRQSGESVIRKQTLVPGKSPSSGRLLKGYSPGEPPGALR